MPNHASAHSTINGIDLFDAAPCAMVICDKQGYVQKFNARFARLAGWEPGADKREIKFKSLLSRPSQFIYGSHVLPPLHLAGSVQEVELDIVGEDEEVQSVLVAATQVLGQDNACLLYFSLTPAKGRREFGREYLEAKALIERNQNYLYLAEELAQVGHWHANLTTREVFWSPEVYSIHGCDPETYKPDLDSAISFYHEDDQETVTGIIADAISAHRPFSFRKRLASTDHLGIRIVDVHGRCEYDHHGEPTGIFGVFRDVTEEVRSQQSLEASEARYRLLTERANDVIAIYDKSGTFEFVSPSIENVLGYTPESMIGTTVSDMIHPDDRSGTMALFRGFVRAQEWDQPFRFRYRARHRDGRFLWLEANPSAIIDPETGAVLRFQDVVRDVTQQVRIEAELRSSETRSRLLADNIPGMVGYWDSELRCRFANKPYLEWFERSPDTLIGTAMQELFDEEILKRNLPFVKGALRGEQQAFERMLPKPSGEIGDHWVQYLPDKDEDGTVIGFYVLVTDVTALKLNEAALQESNALKSAVLSSTQYLVMATTTDGVVTVFNEAAQATLGYSAEEVEGKATPALWHDEAEVVARTEALNLEFGTSIAPGFATFCVKSDLTGSDEHEWTFTRKDGSRFPVSLNITALHDGSGQVTGYLGVGEDITSRKRAEEALKTSEETFRSAMEYAPIGMAILDLDGRWLQVNKALCELLDFSQDEFLAQDFRAFIHPDDVDDGLRMAGQLLDGEIKNYSVERRHLHKSGHYIWTELSVSLVRHPNGEPHYIISQFQDITQRREVERLKSEFISTVSHELRTPLTSIRGALGLIGGSMAKDLPAPAVKLIDIAHKNSERLVLLINDILDIDKIASGNMRFEMREERLGELVSHAVEANQSYAARFDVTIVAGYIDPDLRIMVDAARFQQVLSNLLSNASKFSPSGRNVDVCLEAVSGRVRIAVRDYGPGITEEFRHRIFGKFSQADSSATREKGGTGLGLHISRQILDHMDGTIGFESTPGNGANFWIEFPLVSGQTDTTPNETKPLEPPAFTKLPEVLHVEDDADLSLVLGSAMQGKINLTAAPTLSDARKQLSNCRFDLLIVDVTLPDGSGLNLLEELRQDPGFTTPVMILSANDVPSVVQAQVAATMVKARASESNILNEVFRLAIPQTEA